MVINRLVVPTAALLVAALVSESAAQPKRRRARGSAPSAPAAPTMTTSIFDVRQLMDPATRARTGVDKLDEAEVAALNAWFADYAVRLLQYSERRNADAGGGCNPAIETKIDDDFEGWDGDTIFKLANGQIWKQSSYAYTYHYSYRPDVVIYASGGGCKLKVDGVSGEISVERLK